MRLYKIAIPIVSLLLVFVVFTASQKKEWLRYVETHLPQWKSDKELLDKSIAAAQDSSDRITLLQEIMIPKVQNRIQQLRSEEWHSWQAKRQQKLLIEALVAQKTAMLLVIRADSIKVSDYEAAATEFSKAQLLLTDYWQTLMETAAANGIPSTAASL